MRFASGVTIAVSILGAGGGELDMRIVGGLEARPQSFPWIISLQQDNSHFCSGSLVRAGARNESDIVLTAAHCVADGHAGFTATAGAHDLTQPTSGQLTVRVLKAVMHPSYNPYTAMNDIAVLKLERPIHFVGGATAGSCGQTPITPRPNGFSPVHQLSPGAVIQPICLPTVGEVVPDDVEVTVAGWGLTTEGGDMSRVLMQVGVPTINFLIVNTRYLQVGSHLDPRAVFGAGYAKGGKDVCLGDGGGPLVLKNTRGYALQGITTFSNGCARPGLPGLYTRVSNYIPWINMQIKSLSSVK